MNYKHYIHLYIQINVYIYTDYIQIVRFPQIQIIEIIVNYD